MATRINLRERFGHRYRIEYDPARNPRSKADDAWLQIIPSRAGHIYPHGGDKLGVATNTRGIGLIVARIPGVEVWQSGSDGMNLVFDVSLLPQVAKIVRPKRKRQLTPEQRQAAVERLAKHRFSPARQCDSSGQIPAIAG